MPVRRLLLPCALLALLPAAGVLSVPSAQVRAADPAVALAYRSDLRPLPFFYDLYTFRGRGGRTDVVSAFAVEAGHLETETARDGIRYRFSVTLILADTARRTVWNTHDTVYVNAGRPMPDGHLLFTHVQMPAPPSRTTLQRVIMNDATSPGIGQLYMDSLVVPDYSGSQLMLSDIAPGQPEARAGWKRGNVTLALLPTSQFPSSAFDVYYEIYNLPRGNDYVTAITIQSLDRRDAEPVTLRFEGVSAAGPDGMHPELRRVETSLPRGVWRITVRITDSETGTSAVRHRDFEVRGTRGGASMVPALKTQPARIVR